MSDSTTDMRQHIMTPEQCDAATILKIVAGSHVHGLNTPESDRDEEAIVIEPLHLAVRLGQPWDELERTKPDRKWYSLRKWCQMATKGNPNFILMLFAPMESVLSGDARGFQLREMASSFISKQAIRSHLGYMQGQRSRLINHQRTVEETGGDSAKIAERFGGGGGRGLPRYDLIQRYGYDTKFGMHLLRLAIQGIELATTGRVTLPMREDDRQFLLAVRHGQVSFESVLERANNLEALLKKAFEMSSLPDEPDYATVEKWMQTTYIRAWHAQRALEDAIEDAAVFNVH